MGSSQSVDLAALAQRRSISELHAEVRDLTHSVNANHRRFLDEVAMLDGRLGVLAASGVFEEKAVARQAEDSGADKTADPIKQSNIRRARPGSGFRAASITKEDARNRQRNRSSIVIDIPQPPSAPPPPATPRQFRSPPANSGVWVLTEQSTARYKTIPVCSTPKSALPECVRNKRHNRHMDVLPNPLTRVPLRPVDENDTDPASTYINANFVPDFAGRRQAYICAQGPMSSTTAHFWRMVMQHRVVSICMLTTLQERGKPKCAQYWPQTSDDIVQAGDLTVWHRGTRKEGNVTITRLSVRDKSGNEHDCSHYWYFRDWPDHGIPKKDDKPYPNDLLRMIDFVDRRGGAPLLFHCSAGVGRSGTAIAVDVCCQALHKEGRCDPIDIITSLRQARVGLVQTAKQYTLVHAACAEYARRQGMDVDLQPCEALPTDWQRLHSSHSEPYYWNTATGETSWLLPRDTDANDTTANGTAAADTSPEDADLSLDSAGDPFDGAAHRSKYTDRVPVSSGRRFKRAQSEPETVSLGTLRDTFNVALPSWDERTSPSASRRTSLPRSDHARSIEDEKEAIRDLIDLFDQKMEARQQKQAASLLKSAEERQAEQAARRQQFFKNMRERNLPHPKEVRRRRRLKRIACTSENPSPASSTSSSPTMDRFSRRRTHEGVVVNLPDLPENLLGFRRNTVQHLFGEDDPVLKSDPERMAVEDLLDKARLDIHKTAVGFSQEERSAQSPRRQSTPGILLTDDHDTDTTLLRAELLPGAVDEGGQSEPAAPSPLPPTEPDVQTALEHSLDSTEVRNLRMQRLHRLAGLWLDRQLRLLIKCMVEHASAAKDDSRPDHICCLPFGELARTCGSQFETLSGILKTARERGVVDYEGTSTDCLCQGTHEDARIWLLRVSIDDSETGTYSYLQVQQSALKRRPSPDQLKARAASDALLQGHQTGANAAVARALEVESA